MKDDDTNQDAAQLDTEIADLVQQAEAEQARNAGSDKPEAPAPAVKDADEPKPEATPKADVTAKPETPVVEPKPAVEPKVEDESERNRQAAATRIKLTELERERDEWKRKAEEAGSREPAAPQPEQSPRSTLPPDQVFNTLARATRGEFEQPGQNDQVRLAANRVILDEMSSADIAVVQRNALMGQYGEASGEIADLASKYLPLVQHRERSEIDTRERQTVEQRQVYQAELAQARREFPDLCDANKPEGKFLHEYEKVIFGDGPMALPKQVQAYVRQHPAVYARLAAQAYSVAQSRSAASTAEVTKLRSENEAMRKKLALKDSPESPSAPINGDHQAGDDELSELYRRAEEEQARNTGR